MPKRLLDREAFLLLALPETNSRKKIFQSFLINWHNSCLLKSINKIIAKPTLMERNQHSKNQLLSCAAKLLTVSVIAFASSLGNVAHAQSWTPVGSAGFSAGQAEWISMTLNAS